MANHSTLDRVLGALADPTRRAMLDRLGERPATVSQLAEPHGISLPTAMKHLGVLESAGLVTTAKRGRVRTCTLHPAGLTEAQQWIDERRSIWNTRLDALSAALDEGDPA